MKVKTATASPAGRAAPTTIPSRAVGHWLLVCAGLVFLMVVIGGLTRLTDSGLSMVEWQVFRFLPPMNHAEWMDAFAKYQQFPEYQKINHGMDLAEFQGIFWLEYIHRLAGRLLGFVFLVPFMFFLARGAIARKLARRLIFIFLLGGLQGVVGWYMVKSGLIDRPDVSHYRLSAHLLLAITIFALLVWTALDQYAGASQPSRLTSFAPPNPAFRTWRLRWWAMLAWILVTIVSGAFVAGLDAGLIYNTFPMMDGSLVPTHLIYPDGPHGALDDIATVQFNHRLIASLTALAVLALGVGTWKAGLARLPAGLAALWVVVQAGLGISTLLLAVPLALASLHQAGAVILVGLVVWTLHALRPI
jgi:cytochrome c oxidase assembly protein subunit 15